MKKAVLVLMVVLMLTATCWAQEKAAPKGQDVTITGMMSCTFCNLATPSKTCTKHAARIALKPAIRPS